MKNTINVLLALIFVGGMGTLGFAEQAATKSPKSAVENTEVIRGKIVSIDTAKNTIVVKEKKAGVEKTIGVDPKELANLKVDEDVRVKLNAAGTAAESVKKIVKHYDANKAATKK